MKKHYGIGEFERDDVEVRISNWFFRTEFIENLIYQKGDWSNELVKIAHFENLPLPDSLDANVCDWRFGFMFVFLLEPNPDDVFMDYDLLDTPLFHYCSYFFDKTDILEKLEDENTEFVKGFETRKLALRKLIPNWDSLKRLDDAAKLKISLENWAIKYNLHEEWFLDYVLRVFSYIKAYFDIKFKNPDFYGISHQMVINYQSGFGYACKEAFRTELNELYQSISRNTIWKSDEEFKVFEFKYIVQGDIKIFSKSWIPSLIKRTDFFQQAMSGYSDLLYKINLVNAHSTIDEEWERVRLNEYCDQIEQMIADNTNENALPFFSEPIDENGLMILYQDIWKPSFEKREKFISRFIEELSGHFYFAKKAASSLKKIPKDDFELKLHRFCENVEKEMRKSHAKTPVKYIPKHHFEWLIDFQIAPVKSYKEIWEAIKYDRPTVDAIKKGVQRLSQAIGITLRKPPRTGRPKGIIENPFARRR